MTDIAVIGMAGVFPGSRDIGSYWDTIISCKDTAIEIPVNRFDWRKYYRDDDCGAIYAKYGHFIDDDLLFDFDYKRYGLNKIESANIDPQQRILIKLIEDAKNSGDLTDQSLNGSKVGIIAGLSSFDNYLRLYDLFGLDDASVYQFLGNNHSACSSRIAQIYNLLGPAFSIDTLCASSISALASAISVIETKQAHTMIVGAVSLILHPYAHIALCNGQLLAKDGESKAFSKTADGYGRGEGAGVLILKNLKQAKKDRNNILAIISNCVIGHVGNQQGGFTVPNVQCQIDLIQKSIGIKPIDYIEAHATGTALGDQAEITAFSHCFQQKTFIGSVKANVGHLEAASGMASFIKAILMLKHQVIPRHKYYQNPSSLLPDYLQLASSNRKQLIHNILISNHGLTGVNGYTRFTIA